MVKKWIRICPRCGSHEVKHRGMISEEAYSNTFVCLTCGYHSPIFPEVEMEPDDLKVFPKNFIASRTPPLVDAAQNRWRTLGVIGAVILIVLVILLIL